MVSPCSPAPRRTREDVKTRRPGGAPSGTCTLDKPPVQDMVPGAPQRCPIARGLLIFALMNRVTRRTISPLGLVRVVIVALALLLSEYAAAQQMAPRAYWPAPKGTRLALVGFGYQAGDVVTDPTLAFEDADSRLTTGAVGYQQTIELFGRTSNVQFELPFASGTTRAALDGQALRRDVSGVGDVAATLSLNLYGAPSMNLEEFQAFRANPGPIVGRTGRRHLVFPGQRRFSRRHP